MAQQKTVNFPNFDFYEPSIFSSFSLEKNAPVTIDGREIFTVGSFIGENTSLSAPQRANDISKKIENAVQSSNEPQLEIKTNNGLPTIFLNNEYLFTVTQKELTENETLDNKALSLRRTIANAIIQAQQERSNPYQYQQYIIATVILIIAIFINRLLHTLQSYSLKQALQILFFAPQKFNKTKKRELSFLEKIKLNLTKFFLWLTVIYLITDLFPFTRSLRYQTFRQLWNYLNYPLFSLGDSDYSIINFLVLIAVFWGLISLIKRLTNFLRDRILHRTGMSRGSQEVIFIVTKYGLISLGTIVVLQLWGLNLSSLTILGSALGVGIGFGFQDIAKNFASGLVLLFERSVQVGDFIEIRGQKGTVERVGARSIVLRTLDRISIIVPNSSLLADEVVNWTHDGSVSRLHLPVGVAYSSNPDVVRSVLLEAAATHVEVLRNPAPQVLFDGFGESSLNFQLLVWITEPSHQVFIKSDLYFQIEKLLRKHQIEIPFPHRDIKLRNPNLSLGLSTEVEKALFQLLKHTHNHQATNHQSNQKHDLS